MREYGVIINDLNADVRRQGFPKSNNVHSVGNLAPKVTETIRLALADRKTLTRPLPRVLLIGDSITGSYHQQVMSDLDGQAAVFKNPGNAEDTWNGLEKIDQWLDLKRHLLNGQEYLELVDGVKDVLGDALGQTMLQLMASHHETSRRAGSMWMKASAIRRGEFLRTLRTLPLIS